MSIAHSHREHPSRPHLGHGLRPLKESSLLYLFGLGDGSVVIDGDFYAFIITCGKPHVSRFHFPSICLGLPIRILNPTIGP